MKRKQLVEEVYALVEPFKRSLWPIYFEIFIAANKKKRIAFFQENLIRALWSRFVTEKGKEITEKVNQAKTEYMGDMPKVFENFLADLRHMEESN